METKTKNQSIVYLDPYNKDHVNAVSNLHIELLPESILSQLGYFFLTKFYYKILTKDNSIDVYLYKHNNEYVGFIACANNPFTFIKDGIKSYFLLISVIMGLSIVKKPKRFPALVNYVFQLKRDILLEKLRDEYGNSMGQLLSFGVLEKFRNSLDPGEKIRIPDVLMKFASAHFKTNKKNYTFAQIYHTNLKAILFHLKHSGRIIPSDNPSLVVVIKENKCR